MNTAEQEVTFATNDESLRGRFITPSAGANARPHILFLHGAGKSTKERSIPLATRLAEEFGLSSFAFDFSGHGNSTGLLAGSSLEKRTLEAKVAIRFASFSRELTVCGFSMGAHIALELLKSEPLTNLVLFYPGLYASAAFNKRFGNPEFSAVLRQDKSWELADVLIPLRRFEGNLLIVLGENDQVVPREVPELIYSNATSARTRRIIEVPGAPHLLLQTLFDNHLLYTDVCRSIATFVDAGKSVHTPIVE